MQDLKGTDILESVVIDKNNKSFFKRVSIIFLQALFEGAIVSIVLQSSKV